MPDYALHFVKADPSGNTTIIILDPVPEAQTACIAKAAMQAVGAEQVGFMRAPQIMGGHPRLEMMGGEFCGNAARSFAAWLAMGGTRHSAMPSLHPLRQSCQDITLAISGHNGALKATVEDIGKENGCLVAIHMPLPQCILHGQTPELGAYSMIGFEGITHVALWERAADAAYLPAVRELVYSHGMYGGCYGALFTSMQISSMTPLVCVEEMHAPVWESSCGSGTVAVACALASRSQKTIKRLELIQPGGSLFVDANWENGRCTGAKLSGNIYFTAPGTLYL